MMAERVTETEVDRALQELRHRLINMTDIEQVILHQGNSTYKVPNRLVVVYGSGRADQLWRDGNGGFTKRDAYRALKIMAAALDTLTVWKVKS